MGYIDIQNYYHYTQVDSKNLASPNEHIVRAFLFKFRSVSRKPYLVKIEEYPFDIFMIKYFPAKLELSPQRYERLTNENDASKILSTVMRILIDFMHKKEYHGHYGFIGSRTLQLQSKENYKDSGIDETQKFRVYRIMCADLISEEIFQHYEHPDSSFYLMVNRNDNFNDVCDKASQLLDKIHLSPLREIYVDGI